LPLERYRLREPTLALFDEDGRHVVRTVPAGATVALDRETGTTVIDERDRFDSQRMVGVLWNGTRLMMFTQDLRSRAELVEGPSA
jgi:hypothetical protein